jgi:hypothetical protein
MKKLTDQPESPDKYMGVKLPGEDRQTTKIMMAMYVATVAAVVFLAIKIYLSL